MRSRLSKLTSPLMYHSVQNEHPLAAQVGTERSSRSSADWGSQRQGLHRCSSRVHWWIPYRLTHLDGQVDEGRHAGR